MRQHAALYVRISKADGRTEKIEDQERWGREYAAQTWPGLPVVVYPDNDRSAVKDNSTRPGYLRLREAIARGEVAQLWAKEQSRIERDEIDWFTFAVFATANGLTHVHLRSQGVQDIRGVVAGISAVLSAHEVRQLTGRINDRLQKIAEAGLPPGGKPFGYAHGLDDEGRRTYVIVPEQAEAIRWAADRVLAGWSLSRIAKELRERGVTGGHQVKVRDADGEPVTGPDGKAVTRPGTITPMSVRSMLTRPTVAGHRVHRGRDLGPGSGNWAPILDESTWQACRAQLGTLRLVERSDGTTYRASGVRTGATGRVYLVTGLAVCGICGTPLVGSLKQLKGRELVKPYLLCNAKVRGVRVGKGCIGIMLTETEKYIVDRLFAELDKPEFLDAIAADEHAGRRDEIAGQLLALEQQREELAAMWATPGELTTAEWKMARHGLDEQESQLRAGLAAVPPPLVNVDIAAAREAWPLMTIDEQRHFLRLFIARVTIKRAKPGTKGFDPGRVEIEWLRA